MWGVMSREALKKIQLYSVAFLAPAFLFAAISSLLALTGVTGNVISTPVKITPGYRLDFDSPSLQENIEMLLIAAGYSPRIQYVEQSKNELITYPTSRSYFEFVQTENALTVTHNAPDFVKSLRALHIGHGPKIFQLYQKLLALGLLTYVSIGLWLSFQNKNSRALTVPVFITGIIVFCIAAFMT